jgi:hypothetical protein
MKSEASIHEVQSSGDPAFRHKMMREVIEAVEARGTLFMPLLNLVTTFIDGLASGAPGNTKKAYLAYLDAHFPDLCKALGAEVFYTKYRCGAVHEFNLKDGFAIGRDSGMSGAYSGSQVIKETGQQITILNIDRLVNDFLAHVGSLEQSTKPGGV